MHSLQNEFALTNPHAYLGIHLLNEKQKVIRIYRPEALSVYLEVKGRIVEAVRVDPKGVFEHRVPIETTVHDYRVYHHSGMLGFDPYAFLPTFGEMDAYLFGQGVHYKLYEVLGARVGEHQGVRGTKFTVWAPRARSVALVGDFNQWDGRVNPMRLIETSGVWELFVPGIGNHEKYKFEIHTEQGFLRLKSDPCALSSEMRPSNASVVYDVDAYQWKDQDYRRARPWRHFASAMNIYEVHLGSWRKKGDHFKNYREIALELASYCKEMGFTHVELLPLSEHPLDESWGYQVTGFFATTSRYGTPEDFQFFVDHLHCNGIGVFLDWVPAHFPVDDHSLSQFDGSYLFEHEDPRLGFHPHWNTLIFNYGVHEVRNFLIASALFWLDKMHIDGLRVDAVASMLYLDYGRSEGEWIPNCYGGRENLDAIEFMKHLNSVVHERFPHAWMIAEESSSYMGVSHPLESGGLGFDLKWNMGWMNDTLHYFQKDPIYRFHHHNELTFGLIYAFSERFLLPLSHDEVVHGKSSLLSKMPGDDWQKFANLRLLRSYQMCQPGKKLLFMGGEIGQWHEWNCKAEIAWELLEYERHFQLQRFFKELNHLYLENPALWEYDFDGRGFEWIDFSDRKNSVISYLRKGTGYYLLIVHNFTSHYHPHYFIRLQNAAACSEVFNTDREEYGGSGKLNTHVQILHNPEGKAIGLNIQLAPLATQLFEIRW